MPCQVKVNQHGYLAFRFTWDGRRYWEGAGWKDTEANRKKAEGKAIEIAEEIKAGNFNYLKWFSEGNKAREFGAKPVGSAVGARLKVKQRYDEWILKKKPRIVRASLE
jgi:hypothetical protein